MPDTCNNSSSLSKNDIKRNDEKVKLVDHRLHRVSAAQALFLRYAAIVVSWLSCSISLILAGVAIGFAADYGTQSLFGFGLDSLLDSLSSMVILWRFHGNDIYSEIKELRACLVIGILFLVAGAVLAAKSIYALVTEDRAEEPTITIWLSGVNLVLCCFLGVAKAVIGYKLESRAIIIDSIITFVGGIMAAYSLAFSSIYKTHKQLWYLDNAFALLCCVFLFGYGSRILCVTKRDLARIEIKDVSFELG